MYKHRIHRSLLPSPIRPFESGWGNVFSALLHIARRRLHALHAADKNGDSRLREAAGLFEAGLAASMARDWDKAESFFRETLGVLPGDKPSTVFLERVKDLRTANLPDDRDGVYVMTKK